MAKKTSTDSSSTPSRRDEILAAAARVIAERGIKQATVRDIGDAAGILSGSLYYHFESKDQIVLELLLPSMELTHASARAIFDKHSGLGALSALIRDSVLATAANPERSVILRNEARIFAELPLLAPVNELRGKIVDLWFQAIERGISDGEIRPNINAGIVARAILDGTLGASRWFDGTREAAPDTVADSLVEFYVSGLAAH
ncbi:MAG: TetR/AcrR family transcriptional regulator [Ilumatobacter sp.]